METVSTPDGLPAGPDEAKYNPGGLKNQELDFTESPIHSSTMALPFLHPDQSEFIPIRRGRGLYVDKTGHLRKLLASAHGHGSQLQSKYAFLARPRRFGKTLLVATLEAFFQGDLPRSGSSDKVSFDPDAGERAELFNGTAVEDLVRQTRAHPVVRLNLAMGDLGHSGTVAHKASGASGECVYRLARPWCGNRY